MDGEVAVPDEAVTAAGGLRDAVREIAASLPFGADPGAFAAALERLAADEDEPEEALP